MVLKEDGSVWSTGWNKYGQLGDGSTTDKTSFIQVVSSGAKAVAAGWYHSMVLMQDGSVWACGYNRKGQLGDGSTRSRKWFKKVISGGVQAIAAGMLHSMVQEQYSQRVRATGYNHYGQLGDDSTTPKYLFVGVVLNYTMSPVVSWNPTTSTTSTTLSSLGILLNARHSLHACLSLTLFSFIINFLSLDA